MNAIAVVIDGWHAGYAGCYGNGWIATPELDRLAAESHVFDQATIDGPVLADLYQAYWRGQPAWAPHDSMPAGETLPQRLRRAGIATTLLTDDPLVAVCGSDEGFDEVVRLNASAELQLAGDPLETRLGHLFAAAAAWLETAKQPFLLWIHAAGMSAPWDAPAEFRARYAEGDAIAPRPDAAVPRQILPPDFDPDLLLPIRWAYAGQVSLLDQCLGGFLEAVRAAGLLDESLLAVAGARGFLLGEHRRIGGLDPFRAESAPADGSGLPLLCEELIHVPWLLRMPRDSQVPARSQALVQPVDLGATILDALACPAGGSFGHGLSLLPLVRDHVATVRDRAACTGPLGEWSIRTRRWRLNCHPNAARDADETIVKQLFVKPDDRWEVNDVADRCGQMIEPLEQAFRDLCESCNPSGPQTLAPLPEELNMEAD